MKLMDPSQDWRVGARASGSHLFNIWLDSSSRVKNTFIFQLSQKKGECTKKIICTALALNHRPKAVQNTFNCAIPIFWSIMKKLWIFPTFQVFFKFVLGAVSCGAQGEIPSLAPQLTAPKINLKKTWKLGKIQRFFMMLQKIGIAQLNVFCTALQP